MAFSHFPQQRRLQGDQREEARTMLELKVNKKMLQNHLSKTSGQVVLLKDLHNLGLSSKDSGSSGIEEAVEELKQIPGSDYFHVIFIVIGTCESVVG